MSDYNGWKNWDTWAMDLWINNIEEWHGYCREAKDAKDLEDRIYEIKHMISDNIDFDVVDYHGLLTSIKG